MQHLLFVCSQNRLRSPTAEHIFSQWSGVAALSAGTNHDATTPVSSDLLEWTDMVIVMEKTHKYKITKKFGAYLKGKKIIVLDIPDEYDYMQPELVRLLQAKVPRYVRG